MSECQSAKTTAAALLVAVVALSAPAAPVYRPGDGPKVYVSPTGRDKNPGLQPSRPLATIERAMELVRDLPTDARRTIVLLPGEYRVEKPVVVTAKDYRLTIKAESPGKAVITGFAPVKDWTADPETPNLFSAPMPFEFASGHRYMMVRGKELCSIAVWPENGRMKYFADAEAGEHHWLEYAEDALPKGFDIATVDLDSAWVEVPQQWATTCSFIDGLDPSQRRLRLKSQSNMPLGRFNQGFMLFNARPGLTAPGRWMYEAGGRRLLYLGRNGDTPGKLDCRMTSADCAFDIVGAQGLVLDGLVFEGFASPLAGADSDKRPLNAVVSVRRSRGVELRNCEIRYAVAAGAYFSRCESSRVSACRVHHTGLDSVRIEGGGGVYGCLVEDCELSNFGVLSTACSGLSMRIGGAKAMRNHIHDGPGNGTTMWGVDCVFASNHVHHVMKAQLDGGGLYGAYNYTLVKDNHVHDTGEWPCLYADEGSQHTVFTGNRCEHWWPTHAHCTRFVSITNNLFVCPERGHRFSFQGSGGGVFSDNVLKLGRDLKKTDYLSLDACIEWARNDVWVKGRRLGRRTYPCGLPDRVRSVVAHRVPDGTRPISVDGSLLAANGWPGPKADGAVPELLEDGRSMTGCPNTAVAVSWDSSKVYFRMRGLYNAFIGYFACRNLSGHEWGHWDGTKLFFGNGLEVEVYPDGTLKSNRPDLEFGKSDSHGSTAFRRVNYAVAVPLSALGLEDGAEGRSIDFNVCCRNEDHHVSAWAFRPARGRVTTGKLEFSP